MVLIEGGGGHCGGRAATTTTATEKRRLLELEAGRRWEICAIRFCGRRRPPMQGKLTH